MTVHRTDNASPFTRIPNATLQDKRLSAKAHGILDYILSMSDGWQFYAEEVAKHFTDGRAAINSGLKELEAAGYLKRTRQRDTNGKMLAMLWDVYDLIAFQSGDAGNTDIKAFSPQAENRHVAEMPVHQQSENENAGLTASPPQADFPHVDKPHVDKPHVDNQTLITNNKITTNTITNNLTNEQENKDRAAAALDPIKPIHEFWTQNGFGVVVDGGWWQEFEQWHSDFKELGASDTDATAIIIRAMQECVDSNVTTKKYLRAILNRYANTGYKSVVEVDAAEKTRQARQATGTTSPAPKRIELTPNQETAFKRFWSVYPSQSNENKARAAYAVALSAKKADPDTLFKAACGYARQVRSEQTEARFIKQAANWINEDQWQADYSNFPASYSDPDFDENADIEFLKHLGEPDTSGKYDIDPDDPFGYKKRGF